MTKKITYVYVFRFEKQHMYGSLFICPVRTQK